MTDEPQGQTPWWRTRSGIVAFCFLAIAAFFLLTEHRAHFFGALPYLLLLACPLMHLFMHRGHHGSGHRPGHGDGGSDKPDGARP